MQAAFSEPVVDYRLYRFSFLPALVAFVVLMFSLEGAPGALEPVGRPSAFDGGRAVALARQIATSAPDRQPGSDGDSAIADLVRSRFEEVPAGAVSEQQLEASYRGDTVALRNVLLTLPGDADRTIVVVAARDQARGSGAAASAAATAILVELAATFGVNHEKAYVLASTSGSAAGAAGTRALLEGLPERDSVEAVIVISQPGAGERRAPFVIGSSTGATSASVQLERTAERAVEGQAGEASTEEGAFTQLARLALPAGLGDQAPLVADGIAAVAVSSAGERPLSGSGAPGEPSAEAVVDFGRAVQSTVTALDVAPAAPVHGPRSHLELGDNLVPGWALAALAATLILPAGVAAVDACARTGRRRREAIAPDAESRPGGDRPAGVGAGVAWAASRSLPFVGGLAALYALAIVGVVPRPAFPFDPGLYEVGGRAVVALAIAGGVIATSVWLLRSRGVPARRAPASAPGGLGLVSAAAAGVLWLANPYLALLAVPAAHAWLISAGEITRRRRVIGIAACLLACAPVLAALVALAAALDLGLSAPWTYTVMLADGQIGLPTGLALSFLAGSLAGAAALIGRSRGKIPIGG